MKRLFGYHRLTIWLFLFCGLQFPLRLAAQEPAWRTFTNMRDARNLVGQPGHVWAATTGGLLDFDIALQTFSQYTNADGLAGNELTAVEIDKYGRVWMGLNDGNINIVDPASGEIDIIVDYQSFSINAIRAFGDTVYIGLDIGVGEYRIDKSEAKELYRQLGMDFTKEIPVTSILVHRDTLYVGTAEGIAAADVNNPNLKAPQSWTNFSTSSGLPHNVITDLEPYGDSVLAGTQNGIALRTGERWQNLSSGLPYRNVTAIAGDKSKTKPPVFVATSRGVFGSGDLANWVALADLPGEATDVLIQDGELWASAENSGVSVYNANAQQWDTFIPDGPKGNVFSAVYFDRNGVLWCTSTRSGFFANDGDRWHDFEELLPLSVGDHRDVLTDPAGKTWVGTWGKGLLRIEDAFGTPQLTKIDTAGGLLSGATTANPGFVVVNDLASDALGNLWLANLGALNGRAVAAVTPEFQWAHFSVSAGLRSTKITRVMVDRFNLVWYGTEDDGVGVLDYGGTLLDPSDDILDLNLVDTQVLFSPHVTALAEDEDGTVWIGTPNGLNYFFGNQTFKFFGTADGRLISEDIRVVRVDPANNKWVGTSAGVSVLMADNFTLNHFTTDNSPLVSNSITDFAFDEETGDVYIATTNGLSVLQTPFTRPEATFELLQGYPNPLILSGDEARFTIKNLMKRSGVTIYTEDGRQIRKYAPGSILGSQVVWDGRDADGNLVSSGIYLFVAHTEDGASAVGKVAVIRK